MSEVANIKPNPYTPEEFKAIIELSLASWSTEHVTRLIDTVHALAAQNAQAAAQNTHFARFLMALAARQGGSLIIRQMELTNFHKEAQLAIGANTQTGEVHIKVQIPKDKIVLVGV